MTSKKTHRMSGPAVVVGYIFIVPSVLGVLIAFMLMAATGGATASAAEASMTEVAAEMRTAGVPDGVIEDVVARRDVDSSSLATYEQQSAVSTAQAKMTGASVGAGVGSAIGIGFAMFLGFFSFVGGLLGYLLTMKKKILQCNACEAVVQAS